MTFVLSFPAARAICTSAFVAGLGGVMVPSAASAQSAAERSTVTTSAADSTTERSRARVHVNEAGQPELRVVVPSYLAVFELIPQRGIAQIYPMRADEAAVPIAAGRFPLDERRVAFARVISLAAAGGGGSVRMDHGFVPARHVVVVAANEPLRIGVPTDIATTMAEEIPGLRDVRSWTPEESDLVALVARVRPASAGAAVTVDLLSLPMLEEATRVAQTPGEPGTASDHVMVSCFGGVVSVSRSVARTGVPFCGGNEDAVRVMRARLNPPPRDPGAGRPPANPPGSPAP
ncbi:MAG: hypothetical protein HY275_10335 [Gemmatimonadetes bacterium]|nr:hypothetical protein [Gemmatimonadota bacterium]